MSSHGEFQTNEFNFRHRECFKCSNCDESLAGQRFTSRDDRPYCSNCFARLFAKQCFACNRAITGLFCFGIQFKKQQEFKLFAFSSFEKVKAEHDIFHSKIATGTQIALNADDVIVR